jgi:hypothetical protein
MVSVSDVLAGAAVVSSGITLWQTSLRAANLEVFVPPVIRYASPYQNSYFEAFEVPLTIINSGARTGTVLSIDLIVSDSRRRVSKRFYSAYLGPWHMERGGFTPFMPISLAGRTSHSETLLFYPRSEETVMQIIQDIGRFQFSLGMSVAIVRGPSILTRLLGDGIPPPLNFPMDLPILDHRAFTQGSGTVMLNHPDWRASSNIDSEAYEREPPARPQRQPRLPARRA